MADEDHVTEDAAYWSEVTPVSLGIAMVGAVLMLIAVFLPRVESNQFSSVAQNTLIQSGDGWWFVGLSLATAGWAWRAYHRRRRTLGPVILGLIAIGVAVYDGTSKAQLRLCSVDPATFGTNCSQSSPSIGIYAAGIGGALAVIGGWQIWRARQHEEEWQPELTQDVSAPPSGRPDVRERLATLEGLRADGVISESEYAERRTQLLGDI